MPAHTHTGDKRGKSGSYHYAGGKKTALTSGKTRRQTREEHKAGRSNYPGRAGWRKARKSVVQFKRGL